MSGSTGAPDAQAATALARAGAVREGELRRAAPRVRARVALPRHGRAQATIMRGPHAAKGCPLIVRQRAARAESLQ